MVNTPEELGAWSRLVLTPGVGPESARRLLSSFGEPQAIFQQTETALCQLVSAKQAQSLHLMPDGCAELTLDTLDWLQAGSGEGRCVLNLGDADYPASLLDIPDPPLMLYALGQTALLATLQQIPEGVATADRLARIKEIDASLDELETTEEQMVVELGVARRPNCRPEIVMGC